MDFVILADLDSVDQRSDDHMLGFHTGLVVPFNPGQHFFHLRLSGLVVFRFRFLLCLGFLHGPLALFQLGPVLQEHSVYDAQIQLAFPGERLDRFLFQSRYLPGSFLELLLGLPISDLVQISILAAGRFQEIFLADAAEPGQMLPDLGINSVIEPFSVVGCG